MISQVRPVAKHNKNKMSQVKLSFAKSDKSRMAHEPRTAIFPTS